MKAPLISFNSTAEFRHALELGVPAVPFDAALFEELEKRGLPPLVSVEAFSVVLGVSPKLLGSMATRQSGYYREFQIPKRSGGQRTILAPKRFIKAVQRFLLSSILEKAQMPHYVTGFVRQRGILANCLPHVGSKYLLNLDLQNFFESVTSTMVDRVFAGFGFRGSVLRVLTGICTYNGRLPQGAPTSPMLANLAFSFADEKLVELGSECGTRYTRYADDLTFSSDAPITPDFLERVRRVITDSGFMLNARKVRFARPGQSKYVTGMVVNEKVQPNREARRRIRAMFYRAENSPERCLETKDALLGYAGHVRTYDPQGGLIYLAIAKRFPKD